MTNNDRKKATCFSGLVVSRKKLNENIQALTTEEFVAQGHALIDDIFGRMAGERPRLSFRSGYVRVVRKQNNTQHAPMTFVDGGLIQR